ncbi:MAG: thiamine phosphate synthase [Maritimibacter sp.]|nr:thiamine phosphate synthase [Maritimibacter sp.]
MPDQDLPQLYLVTPPSFDLDLFPETLARALDTVEIACVRLELATRDEDAIGRGADAIREICHPRDIAVVIADHRLIAERHGLDGVHFTDGARHVRKAREGLGSDAIVGAYCGASRHEGMIAGENGADYVSFGPVGSAGLGDGTVAEAELFQWWSEMIEVPVVAEGGLTEALVRTLAPITDFLAFGEEVWSAADPVAQLRAFAAARS